MRIAETFMSIQGEGPRAGRPCFFVRTAGCNLACTWCDTAYASEAHGTDMAPGGILSLCNSKYPASSASGAHSGLICLTGGEPMLQSDAIELLDSLVKSGFDVDLMTNGTCDVSAIPHDVAIVMDLKIDLLAGGWIPPFLAGGDFSRPGQGDAVKFVVKCRADFEFAASWASDHRMFDRAGSVWAAPAWGIVAPAELASWILDVEPRFRLGLQLHKFIWGAGTRM